MGERLKPWRAKPSPEVAELIQRVPQTRLYLVQRSGPTSFILREEGSEKKHRVMLGATPSCTCCPGSSSGGCKELCLHVLFVMMKVLRVPPSNPLVWQLYLNDRELDEVLRCTNAPQAVEHKEAKAKAAKKGAGEVERKPLSEEEPCPICYEDMSAAEDAELVHCRFSCGNNVHGRCMRIWSDHQGTLGATLSCPLCRGDWGDFKWRPVALPRRKKPPVASPGQAGLHLGTRCVGCRMAPISGKRYRCVVCQELSLCEACFESGHHSQHPMACKETPLSSETMAEREELMPSATSALRSPRGSGKAEASSSGRPPQAVQASSSGAGRGSLQPHPRRASLAGRHGSKQRMQPRPGPDSWNAKEETEASRALSLGECLGIAPVAGLPDAGRPRPGVLLKALSSNGYETGRVRQKALHSKPEQGISGHMPLPSLDIAGSTIRGMQQPAELDTAPGASAPAAGQEAALPRGTVKRGPPGRSSSITWGDLPKVAPGERDNLPGVSGTAVRSFSRSNSSEGERVGERRRDSGDSSAAHAQASDTQDAELQPVARTRSLSAMQRRRQSMGATAPLDLPQIESPFVVSANVTGTGLAREEDGGGREEVSAAKDKRAYRVSAPGAPEPGPPPGEAWGGQLQGARRLPAIHKGTTKKSDASPKMEGMLEAEASLGTLCIGTSKNPAPVSAAVPNNITKQMLARRTFSNKLLSLTRNIKESAPVPGAGPSLMGELAGQPPGLHISRLEGQAAAQPAGNYMSMLDNFFEGPEFDPTFHTSRRRASDGDDHGNSIDEADEAGSSFGYAGGAASLPTRLTIPVIVTGTDQEWVTELNSPDKTGSPSMLMRPALSVPDSMESPTAHLPRWIQGDTSFDSEF